MVSSFIASKIFANQIIFYRRVSSKAQEGGEYRSQLKSIKDKYPHFSIARSTIIDIKEVMSGLADPEVRFGSGIGKALRMLMRHPYAIILVSNLDRVGRRADVFELILAQGLGHRIMDAQTGMNLDELIASKRHLAIEKKTRDRKSAQIAALERYRDSGGVHGSPSIKHQSRHGTKRKMSLAKKRRSEVLRVITAMARKSRGRKLKLNDIADELNRREIRTGQGRFFDAERLSQLRKSYPGAFRKAFDTPLRDRRRIRAHVRTTGIVFTKRHQRQQLMRTLAPIPSVWKLTCPPKLPSF